MKAESGCMDVEWLGWLCFPTQTEGANDAGRGMREGVAPPVRRPKAETLAQRRSSGVAGLTRHARTHAPTTKSAPVRRYGRKALVRAIEP
jgi:hypothetical protein